MTDCVLIKSDFLGGISFLFSKKHPPTTAWTMWMNLRTRICRLFSRLEDDRIPIHLLVTTVANAVMEDMILRQDLQYKSGTNWELPGSVGDLV